MMKAKRILAALLCISLALSLLPATALAAEWTKLEMVQATLQAAQQSTSEEGNTDEYGTKLTVPADFDANDGVHPYGSGDAADTTSNLMPVKEVGVYVSAKSNYSSKVYNFTEDTILNGDNGSNSGIFGSQYDYMETSQYFGGSNAALSTQATGSSGPLLFAAGVAYDPYGTGRDDHVAYVGPTRGEDPQWALYTADASSGSLEEAWRDTWNAGLGTTRKAYEWVKTTTRYDSSGYAAIAAGDFDGDGRDTLVFYDPALSLLDLQEYDENNEDKTSTRIYIDSAHFGNSKTLKELFGQSLDYITLFSALAGLSDSCLNIPMLQMDAGDLDNDGRDELVVTISLSNLDQENVSPNNYNGDRSSVVMLLEKNGGDWELTWAKQMSDVYVEVDGHYNNTSLNPSGGWYMRAASSRIVDYDNDGTKEIITVGVASDDNADDDNFQTSGYIGVIISANGAIQTTSDTKNGSTSLVGCYFPRTASGDYVGVRDSYLQCLCPTSLGVVRFDGIGTRPYIVVRGIIFQYDGSGFTAAKQGGWKDNMFQNRYIMLQPIVGNFDGNRQGREQILFVLSNGSDNDVEIGGWYYNYTTETGADESALTGSGLRSARWEVNAYGAPDVVLTAPDADTNDGMIAEYEGKLYTFADPKILAILEAAPYFEDLKDDYGETLGSTSFSTATGSGSSTETSSTNSAGAYISFEQEISVMGLINVGKVESEVAYTAEWTNSVEQSTEWELELSFDAGRETNRVVLFYTPVIIYNYTVTDLSTGEETTMHINSMRKPVYSTLSVEDYNAGAALRGDPLISEDVISVVPGQPDSYRRDTSGLTNAVSYGQWVGTNSGSSNITQSISYSTSTTLTKEVTHSVDVKAGAGAGGFVVGGTYGHTWGSGSSTTNTESVTRSGTVADIPSDYADDYCFDWQFVTWDTSVTANGKTYTVPVLSYLVRDVEQAPSVPLELNAEASADSVTLQWDSGYNSAASYQVYRYIANDNSGTYYYRIGTVNGSASNADGTYTFTDSGLASGTLYQYAVRAVGADGKRSPYSEIVSAVTSSTTGLPVIVLQPNDQSVLPGSTATFSVTARPCYTNSTLNFIWQSRSSAQGTWRNIDNNNNTYPNKLTVTAEDGMDGTQYRCMVSEVPKSSNTVLCVYTAPATLTVGKAGSTAALSASAASGNVPYWQPSTTGSTQQVTAWYKVTIAGTTDTFGAYANTYDSTKESYPYVYRGTDGVYYLLTNLNVSSEPDSAGVFSGTAGGKTALTAISDQVTVGDATYSVTPVIKTEIIGETTYEVYTATGIAGLDDDNTTWSVSQLTLYMNNGTYYVKAAGTGSLVAVTGKDYTTYTTNENNTFLSGTLAPVVATDSNGYEIYQYNGGTQVYKKDGKYYADAADSTPLISKSNLYQTADGNTTVQLGDPVMTTVSGSSTTYTQIPGQTVTLNVNVSVAGNSGATVPGKVTFRIVNTTTGQSTAETVDVTTDTPATSGTATLTWTPTTAGVYTIVATYGGSTTAAMAVSNTVTYYALETRETTTWYDIGFNSAAPSYGDTIAPTLYSYTSASTQGSSVPNVTFTAYKLLSNGYSTTGTTLPAVLVPGEYTVKAQTTVDGAPVTVSKVLTVSKRGITVAAPNVNENNTLSVEEARNFSLSSLEPTFSPEFVSGDSYPGLFTLTGGPQARAGKYDIKVAYVSDSAVSAQKADFLAKYSPVFEMSTVTVTEEASFVVTYSAGTNGTLTAYGEQYFASNTSIRKGSELIFTATPDADYKISRWTVTLNGEGVDLNAAIAAGTIIVSGNSLVIPSLSGTLDIRVEFSKEIYQVSFSVDGTGGAIKAEQLGTVLTSPANVTGGSSVTFTAVPETGKVVQRWTVNGTERKNPDGSAYTGRTLTLDELAENASVQVRFEDTAAYAVSYSAVDKDDTDKTVAGVDITAWVGDDQLPSGSTAEKGSTVVLTADITPGNAVVEWQASTDGGANWKTIAGDGNTCTIYSLQADTLIRALTITGAAAYTVNFEVVRAEDATYVVENVGTLTAAYNGRTYTPDESSHKGQINCTAYTSVSFAYEAPDDWEVVEWLVNGESVQSGLDKLSYTIESLRGETNVQVVVQKKPQIVFAQPASGTISVTGTVNGTEKAITSGTYVDYGTSITVTVAPDAAYVVTRIHTADVNSGKANGEQSETFTITMDQTITAVLTAKPVVTIVNNAPANGAVEVKGTKDGTADTEIKTGGYVDFGTALTVTLMPVKGYIVADTIKADYTDGDGTTTDDKTYTIENVMEDRTVTALWAELDTVGVTFTVLDTNGAEPGGTNGTVSASVERKGLEDYAEEDFAGGQVYVDSSVTFTAEPDEGYRVKEWRVNGQVQTENGITLTALQLKLEELDSDAEVTVQFTELGDRVTIQAGDHGRITSAMVGTTEQLDNIEEGFILTPGATVIITAEPDTGYEVERWAVNGETVENETENSFSYTGGETGAAITVTFRQVEYPVSWSGTNGSVSAEGYEGGSAAIRGGTTVTFTAEPDEGYEVTGWTVNGETVEGETGTAFVWTVPNGMAEETVTEEYRIEALFDRGLYTVTIEQPEHGSITANRDLSGGVRGGTTVTFTAEPNEGYLLVGWTVNGETEDSSSKTYSLTVNSALTVTAVIVPDHYTVTYGTEGAGGTVAAAEGQDGSVSVAYGGSVTFTAAPDDYYHVKEWKLDGETVTQGVSGDRNSFTLSGVTADHEVAVVFEAAIRYEVSYAAETAGGSLTAKVNDEPLTLEPGRKADIWGGSRLVFTAAPEADNMAARWTVNGTPVTRENMEALGVSMDHYLANTLVVESLSSDLDVRVSFAAYKGFAIPGDGVGYTVTVDSRDPADTTPDTEIRENGDVSFTIRPKTGSERFIIGQLRINGHDFINGGTDGNVAVVKNADGSYTVTITGVTEEIEAEIAAYKVEIGELRVPEALRNDPNLDTVEEIRAKLETRLSGSSENRTFCDIVLKYYDGTGWVEVSEAQFPADGVDVVLPYPQETDSKDSFTVVHMLTVAKDGRQPGSLETVSCTKEADGLHFHVSSLSPFGVSWVKYTAPSGGGGGMMKEDTVIIEPSENGTVSADDTAAGEGDTVVLTVEPDHGYVLKSLTVTDEEGREVALTKNPDGTYSFTMPEGTVRVMAAFCCDGGEDCPAKKFTDVDTGKWYHEAIDFVLRQGMMEGTGDTTFEPDTPLTRGMLVTVLWRMEGKPDAPACSFEDVSSGAWYAAAVNWAQEQGVVEGYNGRFAPLAPITREQLATILWRWAGRPESSHSLEQFSDADQISGYAETALAWANENGIVNGRGGGILDPKGQATRAEAAQMLMNFCALLAAED